MKESCIVEPIVDIENSPCLHLLIVSNENNVKSSCPCIFLFYTPPLKKKPVCGRGYVGIGISVSVFFSPSIRLSVGIILFGHVLRD